MMHPVNRLLSTFGLKLSRTEKQFPADLKARYSENLAQVKNNPRGFLVLEESIYEIGIHPSNYMDHECAFVAEHLRRIDPKTILDIGSYRLFIAGLLSHFPVTTIDIRQTKPLTRFESVITCDASKLVLPDSEYDAVTSCCSLEHFGLGRYGDDFDLDADMKAFAEMKRVLKPNGHLIFTTSITNAEPTIVFNAHRIYDLRMLRKLCFDLVCVEERFFSRTVGDFCNLEEVTTEPGSWDVYCGCWMKNQEGT